MSDVTTTVRIAKTVLLNSKNQILQLVRSPSNPLSPGRSDLPGGTVEAGESFEVAACRELFEETGIRLPLTAFSAAYATTEINKDGHNLIRVIFVARTTDDSPIKLSGEHQSYRWLPIETAAASWGYDKQQDIIAYLQQNNLLPLC